MDLTNIAMTIAGICVIIILIFVTVFICSLIFIGTKDIFDQYKADKKKLYKRDFRES